MELLCGKARFDEILFALPPRDDLALVDTNTADGGVRKIDILSGLLGCFLVSDCFFRAIVPPKAKMADSTRRLAIAAVNLSSLDCESRESSRDRVSMTSLTRQLILQISIADYVTYLISLRHTRNMTQLYTTIRTNINRWSQVIIIVIII